MSLERDIRHGQYSRETIAIPDNGKPSRDLGRGWTVPGGVKTEHYAFKHSIRGKEMTHERTFALKKYGDERFARQAYNKYIFCHEAGLPVAVTFGIDENDPGTLIASDLSCEGKFLVESANIHKSTISTGVKVTEIVGLPLLAKRIARVGALAAARGIRLTGDTVFFRLPTAGGKVSIDFAIGDFDNNYFMVNGADRSALLGRTNAKLICDAFLTWVRKWPEDRMSNAQAKEIRLQSKLTNAIKEAFPKAFATIEQSRESRKTIKMTHHDRIIQAAWDNKKNVLK
jgi:hypothetical protein